MTAATLHARRQGSPVLMARSCGAGLRLVLPQLGVKRPYHVRPPMRADDPQLTLSEPLIQSPRLGRGQTQTRQEQLAVLGVAPMLGLRDHLGRYGAQLPNHVVRFFEPAHLRVA
jgi:hypothetical protein